MPNPTIEVYTDPTTLALAAVQHFLRAANAAVAARGIFTVALAGGSTPAGLYRLLGQPPYRAQVAWERTLVCFGDERCVPPDHPWSNYRAARETLLDAVPLPPANILRMPGELEPAAGALACAAALRRAFGLRGAGRPVFDLILLGMGDDGHTASLFPGMAALHERRRIVVATAVPAYVQPAVPRITLTFPVLNAARCVLFLVAGASKAEKVRAILGDLPTNNAGGAAEQESYLCHAERMDNSKPTAMTDRRSISQAFPAGRVQPRHGALTWLLDRAAAGLAR